VALPSIPGTAWICLGVGLFAGLISLRAHHAGTHPTLPLPDYTEKVRPAVTAKEVAPVSTLLDDIMLAALVVGLVACAVFIWVNLPRLMAIG
jgi:hypothetical protein